MMGQIRRFRLASVVIIAITAMILVALPGAINAEDEDGSEYVDVCPEIVRQALELTAEECEGTGRNEACYGHTNLVAVPNSAAESFEFDRAGDIVKIDQMRSLRLGKMDEEAETWGIALLRLQANLADTSPENVTLILFGETAITDATPILNTIPVRAAADQNVNARSYPSSNGRVLASLPKGTVVQATGRLADDSWLRVLVPDTGQSAWVFTGLLEVEGDLALLSVVEEGDPYYRPMQAFTLETGVDDAPCVEAPNSGLIIQTPEGQGQVTFLVNEVDIQVGSTVFVQSAVNERLDVAVIEGTATVTANGVSQVVPAGTVVSVPLTGDTAAGAPSTPVSYSSSTVQALPVSLLPREFVVPTAYVPPAPVTDTGEGATGSSPVTPQPGQPTPLPGQPTAAPFEPPPPPPVEPPPAQQCCVCKNGTTMCFDNLQACESQLKDPEVERGACP